MEQKKYIFGVDVGGTTIKLGLFEKTGVLCEKWEILTDTSHNGVNILPDIAKTILNKQKEHNISSENILGVGIGVPGPVDDNGIVHKCVNLGWGVFSIVEKMHELTGFKIKANNDANVAALGEMWKGCAQGCKNIILITLGTGIGGGIIVNEQILPSCHGGSGEIGHVTVNLNETTQCSCGKYGCLEQYASATGIVNETKKLISLNKYNTSFNLDQEITAKLIFDKAKENDDLALAAVENMGKVLGLGLSYAGCLCDPDMIVIGGGVSKAGQIIIDAVQKYYKKYVFHTAKDTQFKIAQLGNDAGIYGAARQLI